MADRGHVADGRRKNPRVECDGQAWLRVGPDDYPCSIRTLSIGGASIAEPVELPPTGTRARCTLRVDGILVRNLEADLVEMPNGKPAVLFAEVTHEDRDALADLVRRLGA